MFSAKPFVESNIGDEFWIKSSEKEMTDYSEKLKKSCMRARDISIVSLALITFMFILLVLGLALGGSPSENTDSLKAIILCALVLPVWFVFSSVQLKDALRYIRKANEHRFKISHVQITALTTENVEGNNRIFVYMNSLDRQGAGARIAIKEAMRRRLQTGLTGVMVMVEDESVKLDFDPFWFFPSELFGNSGVNGQTAAIVFEKADEQAQTAIINSCNKKYRPSLITNLIMLLPLTLSFVLFVMNAIAPDRFRPFLILTIFMYFPVYFIFLIKFTRKATGHNNLILLYAILLVAMNLLMVFAIKPNTFATEIRIAMLAAAYLSNLVLVFLLEKEYIDLLRELKNNRFKTSRVMVIKRIADEPLSVSLSSARKYRCVLSTPSGAYDEISISDSQFRHLKDGDAGYLVLFDKNQNKVLFEDA